MTGDSLESLVYAWDQDEETAAIVRDMKRTDGHVVETRVFLKPIFRWAKREPEKAYAYLLWVLQLHRGGDPSFGIPPQVSLQSNYAINTLITASQRCGRAREAQRAFALLEANAYTPDVFAYTALIDVLGRSNQALNAIDTYKTMQLSDVAPNIVTFTTVLRVLAMR